MNIFRQFMAIFIMAVITASLSVVASKCDVRSGANRGWVYAGDAAYYYDDQGEEYVGFVVMPDDGTKRFFDYETHIMAKGEVEIDGNKYLFDGNGIMMTGMQTVNGTVRYYSPDSGILMTGWLTTESGTFYFDEQTGDQVTGWTEIGGDKYYFSTDNGRLIKGLFGDDETKYYSDPDTGVIKTGYQVVDGVGYYFDSETGLMQKGWIELDGETYLFDEETGAGKEGIVEIDGKTYGFIGGKMIKSQRAMAGNHLYYFGDDGVVYREVDGDKPMVAITYDDGPSIYTDAILDVFVEYNQRCTFFIVGDRISWNEEPAIREAELGFEQGNHTYSHSRLTDLDADGQREALQGTDDELIRISGSASTCLRPPEGRWNDTLKEVCGCPIILWSVDSEDWKSRDCDTICGRIIGKVKDGDIILMHDLYQSTADATEIIVPSLVDAGFQLVTVEELGLLRNNGGLEDGVVYYSVN